MTWGSCIPTDSVKSGDDYSSLTHNIGTGAYIDSNKINLSQKRSGCNMDYIKIEKIVVIDHIT